jgi:hypothetical protein
MIRTPSRTQIVLARLVVSLSATALIVGLLMYGMSGEVLTRMWNNMLDRPGGPFVFRFVLQPIMVTIAALRDGIHDARSGHTPFLQAMLTEPSQRRGRLDEAVIATSRIVLLGLVIDTAYQFIEFDVFHPGEAVMIALLLAFVPYVLLRGLVTRIARRWFDSQSAGDGR